MSEALNRMRKTLRADGVDQQRSNSLLFWARSFLTFCEHEQPDRLDRSDIEGFLAHLSEERYASRASRQRVLEAIECLFDSSADGVPAWLKILLAEHRSQSNPNILSADEVLRFLCRLNGREWLAAALICGTGIRLVECVRLRVRDIDFDADELLVRDNRGEVTRRHRLPANVQSPLRNHLENLKLIHIRDIVEGGGSATLPPPIAEQTPNVARMWGWQYLFPRQPDNGRPGSPPSGESRTIHHVDPQTFHRLFERGALEANIYRRVTGHVLRNSFALHMIQNGVAVKRVERMLGTRDAGGDELPWPSLSIPAEAVPSKARLN